MKTIKMHLKMLGLSVLILILTCSVIVGVWGVFYGQAMIAEQIVRNNEIKLERMIENESKR